MTADRPAGLDSGRRTPAHPAMTAPATLPPPTRRPASPPAPRPVRSAAPPLATGQRMNADEFLRRYRDAPDDLRAELVGGVVYVDDMAVRVREHGNPTALLSWFLTHYSLHTPGTEPATDCTTCLHVRGVPQPDALLRVLPEHGGRTRTTPDGLIAGGPELVCEVGAATAARDAGPKRDDYLAAGVREYLLWRTEAETLDWFVLRGDGDDARYEALPAAGGVSKSEAFPGLWLDRAALLRRDAGGVLATLEAGLASPGHAAFAARLAAAGPREAAPSPGS